MKALSDFSLHVAAGLVRGVGRPSQLGPLDEIERASASLTITLRWFLPATSSYGVNVTAISATDLGAANTPGQPTLVITTTPRTPRAHTHAQVHSHHTHPRHIRPPGQSG